MKQHSPHHVSSDQTPADTQMTSDDSEEWDSSDPLWQLLDEASTSEPNAFFARDVLREARNIDSASSNISWTARLAQFFTTPRLAIASTVCACAFLTIQIIPSSHPAADSSSLANTTSVEQANTFLTTDTSEVSDLSAMVMVETLNAAAEDPTIFTRDEVVAMLGL